MDKFEREFYAKLCDLGAWLIEQGHYEAIKKIRVSRELYLRLNAPKSYYVGCEVEIEQLTKNYGKETLLHQLEVGIEDIGSLDWGVVRVEGVQKCLRIIAKILEKWLLDDR